MNKTKIILLAIGGVAVVGTLALGYMIYSSWAAKGETDEELGYSEEEGRRLTGLAVYPSKESVKATEANGSAYDEWCKRATGLAAVGDHTPDAQTPASFKSFLTDEAKRYSEMPGTVAGHFVKSDFGFGFDEYVLKGALPAAADMPRLQREWYDVSAFLNLLVDAKASSVSELTFVREEAKQEQSGRGRKTAKTDDNTVKSDVTRFNIQFTASPVALVAVANAIAANPRFMVAESMSFVREQDEIAGKLGEKSAKPQENTGRRRGRRPANAAEAASGNEDAQTGIITDPAKAPDFKVTMRVAVYDFRTKSMPAATAEKKEESK